MQPTAPPPIHPQPPYQAQPKKSNQIWYSLRSASSFVGFILAVITLATLINVFIFQSYYVDGTSMTPTLQPNERLIINKIPRTWARLSHSHFIPKRGEIVVLDSSLIGPNGKHEQLIKRVVGLPGERVVVKDGVLTVYNTAHPEGLNVDKSLNLSLAETDGDVDITVPANNVFVCGDNRVPGGSYDSRSELGTIESDKLVGELAIRLIPLNRAKFF